MPAGGKFGVTQTLQLQREQLEARGEGRRVRRTCRRCVLVLLLRSNQN